MKINNNDKIHIALSYIAVYECVLLCTYSASESANVDPYDKYAIDKILARHKDETIDHIKIMYYDFCTENPAVASAHVKCLFCDSLKFKHNSRKLCTSYKLTTSYIYPASAEWVTLRQRIFYLTNKCSMVVSKGAMYFASASPGCRSRSISHWDEETSICVGKDSMTVLDGDNFETVSFSNDFFVRSGRLRYQMVFTFIGSGSECGLDDVFYLHLEDFLKVGLPVLKTPKFGDFLL